MSSAAAAMPLATPTKSPKRRAKSQKRKTGPTVTDLLLKTVSASTQRGGMSLSAAKKAMKSSGYDVDKNRARIINALKRLLAQNVLIQTKGTGASGSFKLNKSLPPLRRKKKVLKKTPLKKKPKAKKRPSPKKAAGGATPGAKSPKRKKRRTKAKSPNKVKKPAATKRPKKSRSPKKAKRKVAAGSTKTRAAAKK